MRGKFNIKCFMTDMQEYSKSGTTSFGEGREKTLRREREVTARLCWDDAQKDELLFADYGNDAPPFRETFYKVQQFVQNMAIDFNGKMLALHGVDFMATCRTEFIDCHG
mmetsp:Transcript_25491/g.53852  ORF Transcript_25491/g.53852 Transcript_25491/m.53852 type:complete len:109 (+) Transcript_25491:374-700(+)